MALLRGYGWCSCLEWKPAQQQYKEECQGEAARQLLHGGSILVLELGGRGVMVLMGFAAGEQVSMYIKGMVVVTGVRIGMSDVHVQLHELRKQQAADDEKRHQRANAGMSSGEHHRAMMSASVSARKRPGGAYGSGPS